MGNQALKNYVVDESSFVDGGRYLKWKYGSGYHSSRSTELVTIFLFKKKTLEKLKNAFLQNEILNSLYRDARNLQKLRHPKILQLQEPLKEDNLSLCFITRRVTRTLENYFDEWRQSTKSLKEKKLKKPFFFILRYIDRSYESNIIPLEVKAGFYDICEAVSFLHNDVKICHLNISPTSILLSPIFRWYLGSFGFAQYNNRDRKIPETNYTFEFSRDASSWEDEVSINPCLAYCSPEVVSNNIGDGYASDIFSLGLLLLQVIEPTKSPLLRVTKNYDFRTYEEQCSTLVSRVKLLQCPAQLLSLVIKMIDPNPLLRCSINDVLNSPLFNDTTFHILRFSNSILEKTDFQKMQFCKDLSTILNDMNHELYNDLEFLRCRIIIPLLESITLPSIKDSFLPIIFSFIPKIITQDIFMKYLWKKINHLMRMDKLSSQCVFILLENLSCIIQFVGSKEIIERDIIPFVINCVFIKVESIQVKTLAVISTILDSLAYVTFTTIILPAILTCLNTNETTCTVRVEILMILENVSKRLDSNTIDNTILTALSKLPLIETSPVVAMTCSNVLNRFVAIIGLENSLKKILPLLTTFLCNMNLTEEHFNRILNLLFSQLNMYAEQRRKGFSDNHRVSDENTFHATSTVSDLCALDKLLLSTTPQFMRDTNRENTSINKYTSTILNTITPKPDVHGLHLLMKPEASSGLSQNHEYQSLEKKLETCNLNNEQNIILIKVSWFGT
ncbi:SCY1-like protein 2 isoform X2 [Hylaeus volcanicus]|uniref:SCY1-like protein 2 isoform X2 n=1 Tax=Hylaeus volcanicus TaxID=313075 RepID=UPI0023B77BA9|nr:SCY1-like protein 2 isoform X2 [Hylaeus volcanicus]